LCLLFSAVDAKFQSGQVRIGAAKRTQKKAWQYVSKFGYGMGQGTWQARLKLSFPKTLAKDVKIQMHAYLDEDWPEVEAIEDECERVSKAKRSHDIVLNATGEWSDWKTQTFTQNIRPHIWYIAVSDCNGSLNNSTHRIKFEIRFRQAGGSEFSVEMRYLIPANIIILIGFTCFFRYYWKGARQFAASAGSTHPVIWTLSVTMGVQYLAQFLHTLHLLQYSYNGSGLKALEVISEVLFMLSQVSQASLLIIIALGYTLLQAKLGELDLVIPVSFLAALVHMLLVGLGKLRDDESYKFHENEGVPGWILLAMRLLLLVWFLWALSSTEQEAKNNLQLRGFLAQFRVVGSLYFLAYPAIFMITKCFAPYLQYTVMAIGLMVMQLGSNVWLASLFLTRGRYFRVSTLSISELPGGCRVVKDE
jgi:hypothetical protein